MKIRYYVTRKAWPGSRATWGYWSPVLRRNGKPTLMAKLGFHLVDCGEDGPRAWAIAAEWNERWDAAREAADGAAVTAPESKAYPSGSVGDGFARYRATNQWREKKPRTQEDWWRGWKYIDRGLGDLLPRSLSMVDIDTWYGIIVAGKGVREGHRALKIWRALWQAISGLKDARGQRFCERYEDPSLSIRRKTPKPRNAIWFEGEAVRLVKRAWRMDYRGLAAALAVAWDTMLSPVDVRTLTDAQLAGDAQGPMFAVERAKTGRAAIGTLSKRTQRLLAAYRATLPPNLLPSAPIFYTRGGQATPRGGRPRPPVPYTADTFGDDFRAVRAVEFPGDTRKISDFRRSGAVEVVAGEATAAALAAKMANSIDSNKELQATYTPHTAQLVRLADAGRTRGRSRMRGSGDKS